MERGQIVNLGVLVGSDVYAMDGELGKVDDVLFDDRDWSVQYVVIDIGSWLASRKILISPKSLERLNMRMVDVAMSRDEIQRSLPAEEKLTVSQQQDQLLSVYYREPVYWWGGAYPGGWGAFTLSRPYDSREASPEMERRRQEIAQQDIHLRSFREVKGYQVSTPDDKFGHVEDMLADGEAWNIRYIDIDTRNYLPSRHVALKPDDVDDINWDERQIHVRLNKEKVMNAPRPDNLS